jgi:hypothetical protein
MVVGGLHQQVGEDAVDLSLGSGDLLVAVDWSILNTRATDPLLVPGAGGGTGGGGARGPPRPQAGAGSAGALDPLEPGFRKALDREPGRLRAMLDSSVPPDA